MWILLGRKTKVNKSMKVNKHMCNDVWFSVFNCQLDFAWSVPGQIKSVLSVNEKPTLAAIMYWGISQPVLFYFHAQIFWALILGI